MRTSGTSRARRPLRADAARGSCHARWPGGTRDALDSLRASLASVALLACHARRALNALQSRGTNRTGWTRDALNALRASLTRRACRTTLARVALIALGTSNTRHAGNALRALRSRGTGWADGTGSPLLPSCTRRPDAA